MRQLKTFMKAKKPMRRCGECKCITLQCWKENDEFCNCGDNIEYTPGRDDTVGDTYLKFENVSDNSVEAILKIDAFEVSINVIASMETDAETGDPVLRVDDATFLDDNSYTNEYILDAFHDMIAEVACLELIIAEERNPTFNIPTPEKLKTKKQIDKYMEQLGSMLSSYCR